MKTGLVIGKFLPMHKGHIYIIKESAKRVDELFVIVDEHPTKDRKYCEKSNFPYMNLDQRYEIVKENIKNIHNVSVLKLSEYGIPEFPNGWKEWSKKVINTLGFTPNYIFTSDIEYLPNFNKYFPNTKSIIIDEYRKKYHISATEIRINWKKQKKYLPENVQIFLRKNYE